jgi:hypothetical protein
MKLSLGPLLYYWSREATLNFYEAMGSHTPVDMVYLGETVCSRRHELRLSDWLDIARCCADAGKEVVLSTQVLLESGAEVGTMHKITGNGDFLVEANDMGAVQCLAGKVPFVAGPHLNLYNLPTLRWMAGLGASALGHAAGNEARRFGRDPARIGLRACRPRCSPMAVCRWRSRRAASPHATATCPRTIAVSAAWSTPTG